MLIFTASFPIPQAPCPMTERVIGLDRNAVEARHGKAFAGLLERYFG